MRFLYNPWLLIIIAAVVFSLGTWQVPLFDEDEGAFSEATREMLETGNYLVTYLNGEPRHDKPILIYWLQAASVTVLGKSEFAFRLPSILAALLWALALYRFTRQHLGRDEAGIATLSFVTALMISLVGKWATADALLNLFLALTMFDAWRFAEHQNAKHGWRIYLWMGLGFLTKGPVAIVIPLLAGLPWLLWSGRLAVLWKLLAQPAGWIAFAAAVAPWYIGNAITPEGRAFLQGFLLEHNLERFTETREGHGGVYWYYLLVAPLVIMPFTGWVPGLLQRLPKIFNTPLDRFLWLWFAAVFVFFSLSATQLVHYIVYGLTPIFVLFGRYYGHFTHRWIVFTPAVLFFATLAVLPTALHPLLSQATSAEPAVVNEIARKVTGWPYGTAVIGALIATVMIAMFRKMHAWHGLLLVGLIQAVLVALVIAPSAAQLEQVHIRAAGRAAAQLEGETVVAYGYRRPSFSVYRDAITPFRAPVPGEVVFTEASTLPSLLAQRLLAADVFFASGNVVLARIEAAPGEATPDATAPDEVAPHEAAVDDAAPATTASDDIAPEGTASGAASAAAPGEAAAEDTVPDPMATGETAGTQTGQGTLSAPAPSTEDAPKVEAEAKGKMEVEAPPAQKATPDEHLSPAEAEPAAPEDPPN